MSEVGATEAVQVAFSPHMCCFRCGRVFKEGELTVIHQMAIFFRYPKQRKKAKGNTHIGLRIHLDCGDNTK